MWIAISQRNDINKNGDGIDTLENNYVNYLENFGVKLVIIPNTAKDIGSYFGNFPIKGIILSGGNNVNPELYGNKFEEEMSISKERDETEKRLLEIAINKGLPVLGICRGMQFVNVFFKGKLANIKEEIGAEAEHVRVNHTIKITDKRAIEMLGAKAEVNSYHKYGILEGILSPRLKSFAKTDDGVIEGVYHPSLPIAGIEWHPERKSPDERINERIVRAFLERELFWGKQK